MLPRSSVNGPGERAVVGTSDSVLVAPIRTGRREICARSFIGSGFAGTEPSGEPVSLPIRLCVSIREDPFQLKIDSNYRLPLGRAQGGAFSRRSRKVLQPACVHARTARAPHLLARLLARSPDRFDVFAKDYWSKYGTFRVAPGLRAIWRLTWRNWRGSRFTPARRRSV